MIVTRVNCGFGNIVFHKARLRKGNMLTLTEVRIGEKFIQGLVSDFRNPTPQLLRRLVESSGHPESTVRAVLTALSADLGQVAKLLQSAGD
jgi:hypothetical protein